MPVVIFVRGLSPNLPTSDITLIQGEIMEMARDQQYDVVVSLTAIEHIKDPLSFAKRLRELCHESINVCVSKQSTPSYHG